MKTPLYVAQPSTTTDSGPQIAITADPDGIMGIAQVFGDDESEAQANAAFIVRAVNNHDALVEALDYWMFFIESESGDPKQKVWVEKARAALKAAKP
jgi:hypothetical protein